MSAAMCLPLPGGRKLPLPKGWQANEFLLPGNHEIHLDGELIAVYDETTRTGAVWCGTHLPWWTIVQPFTREDFFGRYVPHCVEMVSGGDVGWDRAER
jgi:hypothetical protein